MDTVRRGGERHIEPIVDDDAGTRTADGVDTGGNKARQRSAVEVAFTDLHEVHTSARRCTDAAHQRVFPRRAEPTSIGDETEDRAQRRGFYFSTCSLPRSVSGAASG